MTITERIPTLTLGTALEYTPEQVFTEALSRLLEQGKFSVDEEGACRYRAPDGCACAVGLVMSNDEYDPKYEANDLSNLWEAWGAFTQLEGTGQGDALKALQRLHDGGASFSRILEYPFHQALLAQLNTARLNVSLAPWNPLAAELIRADAAAKGIAL